MSTARAQPTTTDVRSVRELPRDRIGLIVGTYVVREYRIGPQLWRVSVSACQRGSMCPLFTVVFDDGSGRGFVAVGTQLTFPSLEDCVGFSRRKQ